MADEVVRYDRIDPAVEARVADLLGRMTLAEKIGQLVQIVAVDPEALMEQIRQAEATGEPFDFSPPCGPISGAVEPGGGDRAQLRHR